MSLTLTREDHHLITFNLSNSCVVIDEADFYDEFTQANMLVLLEFLKVLKVPVLLMSASLPESVLPLYQNIGFKISEIKEDTSDNSRKRFVVNGFREYEDLSDIEDLLNLCLEKGSAIIYANTVDKAIFFYKWFDKKGIDICLYHSRFTEPHKQRKEQLLIDMLGKKAWESGVAKGIAILTQIGEMSINISADIMISDLCPMDRLTQRAGRLCRFDKTKIGKLYVVIPQKEGIFYPAPYGEYDWKNKKWIPCQPLIKTRQLLQLKSYNANELVQTINKVYPSQNEFSAKSKTNAKNLKEYFRLNWMIISRQVSSTDDTNTNFWKSRDIDPQDIVFVEMPETSFFNNYLEFQSWKLKNAIELPIYLIEKGKKQHKVDPIKIHIKDETETIFIIREGFYNFDVGIDFIEQENIL